MPRRGWHPPFIQGRRAICQRGWLPRLLEADTRGYCFMGSKGARNLEVDASLSHRIKFGYGAADFGLAAVEAMVQVYLFKFYNVVVGLPALYTGLALALAIVWDAVSDPLMGGISDRMGWSGGRRRPFLLPGAGLLAGSFIWMFNPPDLDGNAARFCFLLVSFILLNTAMTVVGVPHAALGGELSHDRHERTQLFAYRRLFGTLGALSGLCLPGLILLQMDSLGAEAGARARGLASWWLALPIVMGTWFTMRATRGLDRASCPTRPHRPLKLQYLFADQRSTWVNPFFRMLMLAILIAAVARTFNASLVLYYYEYRLQLTEEETIVWVLLPFFLGFLASLPVWIRASRRWGKRTAGVFGIGGLGISTAVAYPLFPVGEVAAPFTYALVGGALAGAVFLMDALVADTIDYDKLRTGLDREGLYFGVWRMGTKLARALGLGLNGASLWLMGFSVPAAESDPEMGWRLAVLFGPVAGILFMVAGFVLWFMPLTEVRHRRIQSLLHRRRRRPPGPA